MVDPRSPLHALSVAIGCATLMQEEVNLRSTGH